MKPLGVASLENSVDARGFHAGQHHHLRGLSGFEKTPLPRVRHVVLSRYLNIQNPTANPKTLNPEPLNPDSRHFACPFQILNPKP